MSFENLFNKRNGDWDYVHDEIIERIGDLEIDCPECESIRHSDDQYACTTCESDNGKIHVLSWIKEQIKNYNP